MKSRTALLLLIVVLAAFGALFWFGIRQIGVRDSGRGGTGAPETRPKAGARPLSSDESRCLSERRPEGRVGNADTSKDVVVPLSAR